MFAFMKTATKSLCSLGVLLAFSACVQNAPPPKQVFAPPYPLSVETGDDIIGAYEGRIPCAIKKCDKMKIQLVLYSGGVAAHPPNYWLGFVEVGDDSPRQIRQGFYQFKTGIENYPNAKIVVLDGATEATLRNYWLVNSEILLPLDENFEPKSGNDAWGQMLSRNSHPKDNKIY